MKTVITHRKNLESNFSTLLLSSNAIVAFFYIFLAIYIEFKVAIFSCASLFVVQGLLVIAISRKLISRESLTHLVSIIHILFLFPLSYFSGGVTSPVNIWLLGAITSIFLIANSRQKVIWVSVVIFTQLINLLLFVTGFEFPYHIKDIHVDLFNTLVIAGSVIYLALIHIAYDLWRKRELSVNKLVEVENSDLKRLYQQYKDVQSMVKAGAWELDVSTEKTEWSDQIYEIYKIPKGTPTNKIDGLSHYAPHEREKLSSLITKCITKGEGFDDTFEFYDTENNQKWVRSIGRPVKNDRGEVVKVIGTFQDVSDHVKTLQKAEALTQENLKYKLWIENTSEGVCQIDTEGKIIFVNQALAGLLEYQFDELIGKSFLSLMDEGDKNEALEKLSKRNKGEPEVHIWKLLSKNNKVFWLKFSTLPVLDEVGNVTCTVAMCSDITAVKEKKEELELVLSSITEGYFDWYVQDDYEYISPRFWEILGYNPEEKKADSREWKALLHPDDIDVVTRAHQEHFSSSGKRPYMVEVRLKNAKGYYIWMRVTGRVVQWGQDGSPLRMIGTGRDIHQEKEKTHEVSLIDKGIESSAIVTRTNSRGVITYVNDLFCQISKYSREELIGSDHRIVNSGYHSKEFFKEMWKTISSKKIWRGEIKNKAKDGSFYWVDTTIIPVTSINGELVGYKAFRFDITDRKQYEHELKSINHKLEGILSEIEDVVWSVSLPDYETLFVTPSTFKLYGVSPDQFMEDSKWWERLIVEDDKFIIEKIYNEISEKGFWSEEYRIRSLDGQIKWVSNSGKIVKDKDDRPYRLDGIVRDISQERELLDKLRDASLRLQTIFNFAPVMVYESLINENWTICYANSYVEQITGYRPEDLINDKLLAFADIIHDGDKEYVAREVISAVSSDSKYNIQYRINRKDGKQRWVWEKGAKNPNSDTLIGVVLDITDQKKSEEITLLLSNTRSQFIELSNNKQVFFKYLLDKVLNITNSEYGFIGEILEDENSKYLKTFALTDISWSEETKRLYQESASKGLEFRNLNTLFVEVIKTQKLLIANDAPNHPKAGGIPKGHPALKNFMGIPILYNGEMFAMIGVANNKLGYKESDYIFLNPFFDLVGEMIHSLKLSSELELQRSITIHNAKLASIGRLAAGVGHEINNPLAIIKGNLDILNKLNKAGSINKDDIALRVDKSLKCVKRIANITNGLRTFSRIDENEFKLLNISELLYETLDMLEEIFKREGIKFSCQIEDSLWIRGNRGRLQQVFVNILNNAKDAVSSMELKEVELVAYKKADKIEIKICDSGPGVPESLLEKVFDPFFTTKDVNQGTGIGLSLASSIIKDHGGTISISPEARHGACFILSLLAESELNAPTQVQSQSLVELQVPAEGKILLVDDEEDILQILQDIIESFGFEVITASNGQEAYEYISNHYSEIVLVLSDIKMPVMNGIDLARAVKALKEYKGQFIFLTGGVDVCLSEYEELVDDILTKPFTVEDVIKGLQT